VIPLKDDNPTAITPYVTIAMIGLCLLAFIWQLGLGEAGNARAIRALGVTPAVLLGHAELNPDLAWIPPLLTVVTSMFLHGDLLHFLGNMLFLWIFGDNVEESMGHVRFVGFYLLCGGAAALAQAVPDVASTIPMIGASGAVSGVLGAYIVRYPTTPVLVALPLFIVLYTVRLPAMVVLGLWFAAQLLSSLAAPDTAGVAFRAHVGGFIAGAVLIFAFQRGWSGRHR
jgi:membrane associated rhomboid family serine protease